MQHEERKILNFRQAAGEVLREIRNEKTTSSLNEFARQYEIDRSNLSKIERGINGCSLATAWRIAEASGVKFSEFAKRLEEKLGDDFKLMDE